MSGKAGSMQGRDEHLAKQCMVLPVSANMFLSEIDLVPYVQVAPAGLQGSRRAQ